MQDRVFSSQYQQRSVFSVTVFSNANAQNQYLDCSFKVSLELSELHSQIKTKFPNIFILKKSSAFCRACKTDISLLGRNVMGNLVQHVKSSGHLHNAGKGDATSAQDIASFFVPVSKKASNAAS